MTNFNYQGVHHCEAAVLSCIDFRFWQAIVDYVHQDLGIKDFDFPSLPGAAKAINDASENDNLAISCINIPVELHEAKKIILVNHADCGAYGGAKQHESLEAEEAFHAQQLRQAKTKILAAQPAVEVILLFAKLVEDGSKIAFVKID